MSDQHLCRVCLSTDNLKSIFKTGKILEQETTLSVLLGDLLSYKIEEDDHLPHFLCSKCMICLVKAYKFQQRCLEAYKNFENAETNKADETIDHKHEEFEVVTQSGEELSKVNDGPDHVQFVEIIEQDAELDNDQKSVVDKSFRCQVCSKVLKRFSSYKYHMMTHSDTKSFKCPHCNESFNTRNAYEGHLAIHEEKHTCKLCNKIYRQAASLRSHMLTHTGEKVRNHFNSIT